MTIYVAGPISGIPDANRPAFEAERRRILELGMMDVEIIIPHDLYKPTGPALECPALCWCEAMCVCLPAVERSGMVFMVSGWERSRDLDLFQAAEPRTCGNCGAAMRKMAELGDYCALSYKDIAAGDPGCGDHAPRRAREPGRRDHRLGLSLAAL